MGKHANAFWSGRPNQFDAAVESETPKCLLFVAQSVISRAHTVTGQFKEGHAYKAGVLKELDQPDGLNHNIGRTAVSTKVAATECADVAVSAMEKLAATVKQFTSNTKNDIASMKAASERVQAEVDRMEAKYKKAQQVLTSPEFQLAIENAERMAIALDAISKLQHTKLTVALFDGHDTP